jgi:hypothetical protein
VHFIVGKIGYQIFLVFKVRHDDRLTEGTQQFSPVEEVLLVWHAVFAQVVEGYFRHEKHLV